MSAVCNVMPNGSLLVAVFGANGMAGTGTILNLAFATGSSAVGGVSPLQFENVSFFNAEGGLTLASHDGSVTVIAPVATPTPTPIAPNLESDLDEQVASSGLVTNEDITKVRRLVAGLSSPTMATNEFQRADASPAESKGDGYLDVSDIVQARRFATGDDLSTVAGGPTTAAAGRPHITLIPGESASVIKAGSIDTDAGSQVTIPIELSRRGDETAAGFTLKFDPAMLSDPQVNIGEGGQLNDTVLTVNRDHLDLGEISVVVDSNAPFTEAELVSITFNVLTGVPSGLTPITFTDALAPKSVADARGRLLPAVFEAGEIYVRASESSPISISGEVISPEGQGIRNVVVRAVDSYGSAHVVRTGSFGMFTFDGLLEGRSYTLTAVSKRFRFASKSVRMVGNIPNIVFVATQ